MEKFVIGRYEYVDFPLFNEKSVKAKIDTGAQTSSIHSGMHKERTINGKKILECTFLGNRNLKDQFENYKIKKIKSSNGVTQKRYVVHLKVKLHGKTFFSRFSLAGRDAMNFPVLIGRNLLRKGFVVDVSKKYIANQKVEV